MATLSVKIGTLRLTNPVLTASGTFGYGDDYGDFFDLRRLGAIVVKGLSMTPRQGNPPPRIVETPSGMLNAIGLQNIGVRAFVDEKLPRLRALGVPVITNFFGNSLNEFVEVAEMLSAAEGVNGLEMNVSCPNKEAGWCIFGTDPGTLEQVVEEVRKHTPLPLIVKLSPNVTDIGLMARVAEGAGADAVSLVNTFTAMVIDVKARRSLLGNVTGGLSGPAIRPIAVRMVWEVFRSVKIPIVGMGGIMTTRDALEFIIAGARAVAVGTAHFVNPIASVEVVEGISHFLDEEGIGDINDLVGTLIT